VLLTVIGAQSAKILFPDRVRRIILIGEPMRRLLAASSVREKLSGR
jgi:hypothetical protein